MSSIKEKTKKLGHWAAENADAIIIGSAVAGLIGFSLYARKVVKDEEAGFQLWKDAEEEKGNRVLPGPEGFYYIFDGDGNQTIAIR